MGYACLNSEKPERLSLSLTKGDGIGCMSGYYSSKELLRTPLSMPAALPNSDTQLCVLSARVTGGHAGTKAQTLCKLLHACL